jgi:ribosomal-protein-alanine N-acetyltransferase
LRRRGVCDRVLRPTSPGRLRRLDDASGVEVLYGTAPAHWGRGLATEVTFAVLRYGLEEAGLGRMLGIDDIDDKVNAASRRVLEKIGMTPEGKTSTKAA